MTTFTKCFIASLLLVCTQALRIKTDVYCSRTSGDAGNFVELRTTITEFGNGNFQSSTQNFNTLRKSRVFVGLGIRIASATFSGTFLPSTMRVRVIESDGGPGDDGVCFLEISSRFSFIPTTVRCIREGDNGLTDRWTITARVTQVP